MKNWVLILCLVLSSASALHAQKNKNRQKDAGRHGLDSRKHLNKSWLDLQNGTLPAVSFQFAVEGGFLAIETEEPNVELALPFGLVAPSVGVNFNPSDIVGIHVGGQFRRADVYYNSFNSFSNGGFVYEATGNWNHKMSAIALHYGLTFHGNLSRKGTTCTGFRLRQKAEYTHFILETGMIYGRTFIDELTFVGSYKKLENGEVVEENEEFSGIMFGDGRRLNRQIFLYAKPGFRFQSGGYATRLSGFFEYQIGENTGLVNDFTPKGFSSIMYGIQLGFEFF